MPIEAIAYDSIISVVLTKPLTQEEKEWWQQIALADLGRDDHGRWIVRNPQNYLYIPFIARAVKGKALQPPLFPGETYE